MIVAATLSVCADCLEYLANGEGELEPERLADIRAGIERERGDVVLSGEDEGFSWSPCQLCESPLGGDRFGAAVLVAEGVGA